MSTEEERRGALMGCLGLLLVLPAGFVLKTYVLLQMWGWFALPLGAPALTYWHLAGLTCLVAFVRPMRVKEPDMKPREIMTRQVAHSIVAPLLAWGFAYCVALAGGFE